MTNDYVPKISYLEESTIGLIEAQQLVKHYNNIGRVIENDDYYNQMSSVPKSDFRNEHNRIGRLIARISIFKQ